MHDLERVDLFGIQVGDVGPEVFLALLPEMSVYGYKACGHGKKRSAYRTNAKPGSFLASKTNKKFDTTTISRYSYTVNELGQRTGVNNSASPSPNANSTLTWDAENCLTTIVGTTTLATDPKAGLNKSTCPWNISEPN